MSLGRAQHEYKKAKDALKEEVEDLQKTVESASNIDSKIEPKKSEINENK